MKLSKLWYQQDQNAQLSIEVKKLMAELSGVPGNRWALNFTNFEEFVPYLLATLYLGKTPILLPNTQPGTAEELDKEYDYLIEAERPNLKRVFLKKRSTFNKPVEFSDLQPQQELVFFTSGSTGTPKKIIKEIQYLSEEVDVLESVFGEKMAQAKILSTVSHQHIYGFLFKLWWPLVYGRDFLSPTVEYPETLDACAHDQTSWVLVSSPAFLRRWLPKKISENNCLMVFSSGGHLDLEVSVEMQKYFGYAPIEIFGSTETGGVAWRSSENGTSTPWRTLPQVQVHCCTDTGQAVVASDFFPENEIKMGDRIEFQSEGEFVLLGRADRVVKIEEKRISLDEVEKCILSHNNVQAVFCMAETFKHRQQMVAAVVLTEPGCIRLESIGRKDFGLEIKNHLAPYFERIVLPRRFRYVSELALTERGKLDEKTMRGWFND